MPKIEIPSSHLYQLLQETPSLDKLEQMLSVIKGEVNGVDPNTGLLKLEWNDTNRPDLWSAAGAARALNSYYKEKVSSYDFFSTQEKKQKSQNRLVVVDQDLYPIRPFIVAFAAQGTLDEALLFDLIQMQEKLCWNFGHKRKTISMGIYRSKLIHYPVSYCAVSRTTRFQPLGSKEVMSLDEILQKHPKGQEYGSILQPFPVFPLLKEAKDQVLSFPPIINSALLGAVQPGETELFVELCGTRLSHLTLAASIIACDLADSGFDILPVTVSYPYDTPFGREITFPYYYQQEISAEQETINQILGESLSQDEVISCLKKMGVQGRAQGTGITIRVPEYRDDFLHPVDIVEDVMIGRGLDTIKPKIALDSTIGRLTPKELLGRRIRELMIGLGFQEMIFTYLGSRKDLIEKMLISGDDLVQMSNPMTENYEFVRNSIAANLLAAESVSAHAIYPHHIFEVGEVCRLEPTEIIGVITFNSLGFLSAGNDVNFNQINSQIAAILYYLNLDYTVKESLDPRFFSGRSASIFLQEKQLGTFGEIHPQVLENWGIGVPVVFGEINLDLL